MFASKSSFSSNRKRKLTLMLASNSPTLLLPPGSHPYDQCCPEAACASKANSNTRTTALQPASISAMRVSARKDSTWSHRRRRAPFPERAESHSPSSIGLVSVRRVRKAYFLGGFYRCEDYNPVSAGVTHPTR